METKSMNVIEYVAPEVEVLEVQVEAGFDASLNPDDSNTPPSAFD